MIPGKFDYYRPGSVDEALALLDAHADDGKILAGGHSLVPMMKLRFAEPAHLIDINAIASLKGVRTDGGDIVIGAATTQAEALADGTLTGSCPIIAEAIAAIADPQVRNCGTLGGNVANGDPGNDLPAVMLALGASYVLKSSGGERTVAAADFYHGTYDTALGENELLTEIRIPSPAAGHGWSYHKMKRKVGDFAIAASAVVLTLDGGTCATAAVALTNVAPAPLLASDAAAALVGRAIDEAAATAAAAQAMAAADPVDDLRGPAAFRKQMAAEMTRRAVLDAAARAGGG
jgi:carbon-monoxide dehydrogenase medium subunit